MGLSRVGTQGSLAMCPSPRAPAGCYSLSVRRSERASWDSVTHYRIYRLENGWLYISPRLTFPTLHDLVDHYSGNAPPGHWHPQSMGGDALCPAAKEGAGEKCPWGWGAGGGTLLTLPAPCPEFGEGLCCLLREPCSMEGAKVAPISTLPTVMKPSLNWDKIDR